MIALLAKEYFAYLGENKFTFSVRTIIREDIPPPAIIIDAGDTLNPFGFVEQHRYEVSEDDFDHQGIEQSILFLVLSGKI